MILDDLIRLGKLLPAYVAARYCYKVGLPTLSNETYDRLEEELRKNHYEECKEYLERSYDDDPVPSKLLELLRIEEVPVGVSDELYKYLEEEKSNSIRAVRSFEEAYEFVLNNRGKEMMFSLKLDGVNKKMLYLDGVFRLSLSRGRSSNSLDYTQGSKRIVPSRLEDKGVVKITGECFVDEQCLPALRVKYNPERYKTCKSAAISMLRVAHDTEDYKGLRMCAFSMDGVGFHSVDSMYRHLEESGFRTPPHFLAIPPIDSLKVFSDWLQNNVFNVLAEQGVSFPSDGVVMEVNDLTGVFREQNQYSDRQIALKFAQWDFEVLKGKIVDIKIEQQRVYKSVRIKIEPIVSSDGCTAEYINSFNPRILIDNDLFVGKTVYFERNAGAVNVLVYGDKLKRISDGGDEDDA